MYIMVHREVPYTSSLLKDSLHPSIPVSISEMSTYQATMRYTSAATKATLQGTGFTISTGFTIIFALDIAICCFNRCSSADKISGGLHRPRMPLLLKVRCSMSFDGLIMASAPP